MRVLMPRLVRLGLLTSALLATSAFVLGQLQPPLVKASAAKSSDGAELRLDLSIINGALPAEQRLIKVQKGQQLRWRINSNQAGEVHLHAYRLHATVKPGQVAELAFTAHATGKFRLEWHGAQDKVSPKDAAPGHHHAPALATLEVRPR
jgi:pullulanase/glycogen debranching enzyme